MYLILVQLSCCQMIFFKIRLLTRKRVVVLVHLWTLLVRPLSQSDWSSASAVQSVLFELKFGPVGARSPFVTFSEPGRSQIWSQRKVNGLNKGNNPKFNIPRSHCSQTIENSKPKIQYSKKPLFSNNRKLKMVRLRSNLDKGKIKGIDKGNNKIRPKIQYSKKPLSSKNRKSKMIKLSSSLATR